MIIIDNNIQIQLMYLILVKSFSKKKITHILYHLSTSFAWLKLRLGLKNAGNSTDCFIKKLSCPWEISKSLSFILNNHILYITILYIGEWLRLLLPFRIADPQSKCLYLPGCNTHNPMAVEDWPWRKNAFESWLQKTKWFKQVGNTYIDK